LLALRSPNKFESSICCDNLFVAARPLKLSFRGGVFGSVRGWGVRRWLFSESEWT